MKKITTLLLALGLVFGAGAAHAGKAKPLQVWEDAAGDAGNADSGVPGVDQAGFDLAAGTINKVGKNLEFTVTHHAMPASGSAPEAFRFLWNIMVDGDPYRFTVKSVDVGKPDVVGGGTGTERVGRVDTAGHFRLEGECITDSSLPVGMINCPVVGYLDGTWDAANKSFTIVLPMKTVKAKTGSVISFGGSANICGICWVTHYAERSLNTTIIDSAGQLVSYKVPK